MTPNQLPLAALSLALLPLAASAADGPPAPKAREFLLTYAVTLKGLEAGKPVRVWLPVPPSDQDQDVTVVAKTLPGEPKEGKEPKHGNRVLYVEAKAKEDGTLPLAVTYRVKRQEVQGDARSPRVAKEEAELFLKPDARVPVTGKPLTLLEGKKLPEDQTELGRSLYDLVNGHMRYSKEGTGWGQGDAVWACESKYGNCSDFHSLFMSLARSRGLPARFEIGFALPEARGKGEVTGYHCWARFKPEGKGWVPVDISEANKNPKLKDYYFGNLTENRVLFTVGRDLKLVPEQDGPPLNFFVFAYAEADGKLLPEKQLEHTIRFEDIEKK